MDDFSPDSEHDSGIHEANDNDGSLGILRYVKSRAKIKPDPVKIEKGKKLDKKDTLAFYDTTDMEEDEKEDNHTVFKQYLLKGKGNDIKATPVPASGSVSGADTAVMGKKKVLIKQEEGDGDVVRTTRKTLPSTPKPSWVIHTKSTTFHSAPITISTTINSRSLLLSAIGKVNKTGGLCGAKGFNCGKPFCWDCIEAEDNHI